MKGIILFTILPIVTLAISLYKQTKGSIILFLIVAIIFLITYLVSYFLKWKFVIEIKYHWIILLILIIILSFGVYIIYLNNKLIVM